MHNGDPTPGDGHGKHEAAQAGHAGHHEPAGADAKANAIVSALFMLLVGLSMPAIGDALAGSVQEAGVAVDEGAEVAKVGGALVGVTPPMGWGTIALHVLAITALANLGKMFPALCYRKQATWQERLAVAIGMWPRGEVGAGVLIISLSYGIGGPVVIVAMLSLALNLVLTGVFIVIVKKLLASADRARVAA
jgi:hypothetical protein